VSFVFDATSDNAASMNLYVHRERAKGVEIVVVPKHRPPEKLKKLLKRPSSLATMSPQTDAY
jgi:hypothetical protein